MAKTNLLLGQEAMDKLLAGASKLEQTVGGTLGPNGGTVIIKKSFGNLQVTKDGVTVAKKFALPDSVEDMGAKLLIEIASSMAVGDGTTSSVVFSYALLIGAIQKIKSGAINAITLTNQMRQAKDKTIELIRKQILAVDADQSMIERVATIAANNDAKIGHIIADAYKQVGKQGVITVEESQTGDTEVLVINGVQFDKGYCSPHFVTNQEKQIAELSDAAVLIYDGKIGSMKSILPVLEFIHPRNKPLLIVADEIEGEALRALILNRLQGSIKVLAIKAPSFGDRRKEMLQDLAILTGGKVVAADLGLTLDNFDPAWLGNVSKITADKNRSIITADNPSNASQIQARLSELQNLHTNATTDYEKDKLRERIAYLSKGVAVIKVGGHSSVAISEAKDRIEDAVCAVQAAGNGGVVAGGGSLFAYIANQLQNTAEHGYDVFAKALTSIVLRIAQNSGLENPHGVVEKLTAANDPRFGYNAKTVQYGDMIAMGVVDAALVLENIVQKGFDGVSSIISAIGLICDEPESDSPNMGGGMGGGY